MKNSFIVIILLSTVIISSCFQCFSQEYKEYEEYLNSLSSKFISQLQGKGINDVINIRFQIWTSRILEIEENERKDRIIEDDDHDNIEYSCILWQENNIGYIKILSVQYFYDIIQLNQEKIWKFFYENKTALKNENPNAQSWSSSEKSKQRYEYDDPIIYRLIDIDVFAKDTVRIFFNSYKGKNDSTITSLFYSLFEHELSKIELNDIKKEKFEFDNDYLKLIKAKEEERKNFFKNWEAFSIPISDNELKSKDKLTRKAYELYEYLFRDGKFLLNENIKINLDVKYFIISSIDTRMIKNVIDKNYDFSFETIKNVFISDFRPRILIDKIKCLYYTGYYKLNFPSFFGYIVNKNTIAPISRLMSGTVTNYESDPIVRKIYFTKNYRVAYVEYAVSNGYSMEKIKRNIKGEWVYEGSIYAIAID